QLATNVGQVRVQGAGGGRDVAVPYALTQDIAGKQAPRVAQEQGGQLVLLGCQVDLAVAQMNGLTGLIHMVDTIVKRLCGHHAAATATQQRRRARQQFGHADGFDEIVVGPGAQPGDQVFLGGAAGDEHHRCVVSLVCTYPVQYIQTAEIGNFPVQEDQIKRLAFTERGQQVAGCSKDPSLIALRRQGRLYQLAVGEIVFKRSNDHMHAKGWCCWESRGQGLSFRWFPVIITDTTWAENKSCRSTREYAIITCLAKHCLNYLACKIRSFTCSCCRAGVVFKRLLRL